jgi:DNA-binding response OmpR family regulator
MDAESLSSEQICRIIVVDDDESIRSLVVATLEEFKLPILQAGDAEEALSLLQTTACDLAVLDRNLPGMQGAELCRSLRASSGGEFVQILMLTAEDTLAARLDCFDCGADDFVAKPFHPRELRARVRALLRVCKLHRDLTRQNDMLSAMQQQLVEHERLKSLTEVAATTAHELGQPISAILLNLHLMKRVDAGSDTYNTALNSVEQDAKRLADLTVQLRDIKDVQRTQYYGEVQVIQLATHDDGDSE